MINEKSLENLMPPWAVGQSGNPKGNPPNIYNVLKKSGYSKGDIRTVMFEVGWMTMQELKEAFENPLAHAMVKLIAHCFKRAVEKGDYRYVAEIIQQTIGAPKQTLDANIIFEQPLFPDIKTIDITPEEPLLNEFPKDDLPK